jgi:hypothetical protein
MTGESEKGYRGFRIHLVEIEGKAPPSEWTAGYSKRFLYREKR